jgi:hypothetical protein
MKVAFTNGSVTAMGVAPATFTTKDELTQFVIENSEQYKRGRITLVSTTEKPDPVTHPSKPDPVTASSPSPAPVYDNGADGANGRGPDDGITVRTVDVPDKAAAIEWLKENYPDKGYTTTKLTRSKEEFNNACAECGVVFNIG